MPTGTCPDRSTLEKLLLGKLPAVVQTSLSEHLEHCQTCTSVAGTLSLSDELTEAIKMRKPLQGDEEILSKAIERGKQLGSQLQTMQPDVTAIGQQPLNDTVITDATSDDGTFAVLAPAQQPDEIGRLGGYRILKVLGIGGMGMVFLAEDPKLKRQIALKVMKPSVAATRSAKDRFLREAQFTAAIEHDNIVNIYQVGEDQGIPFIAMPFLKGESLKTRLEREGKLSQMDVLKIGVQVAAGLAAAHERNLIHRDIKPDNIWLEEKTGRAKILDFGLVRPASNDAGLTQSGSILGTPRYMAPEQALGQDVDFRCDLFSLGSVLYHLVSGQLPFQGSNVTATLMAVVQQDAKPLESIVPDLHPTFCKLVKKLLSKDRSKRPASAKEVAKLLTAIYQDQKKTTAASKPAAQIESVAATAATESPPIQSLTGLPIAPQVSTEELPQITAIPNRTKTSPTPRTQQTTPPRKPPGKKLLAACGAGGLLLMLGIIIITIRDKDGKETTVRGPSGIAFDVDPAPGSKVTIREEGTPSHPSSISNQKSKIENPTGWHGWPADAPAPAIAPFDAAQAKQHQKAWADYLKLPVEYTNSLGMKFVLIPPGEFAMGTSQEQVAQLESNNPLMDVNWPDFVSSESPLRNVVLKQPLFVSVTEVRQRDFKAVIGTSPSFFHDADAGEDALNLPVEMVSWESALCFCQLLGEKEGVSPNSDPIWNRYKLAYRLLSEAEWEYSCRAGTSTSFWHGKTSDGLTWSDWFADNSDAKTHVVGSKAPNPFGLFDLYGNVSEWVFDGWNEKPGELRPLAETLVDPRVDLASDQKHVIRGANWGLPNNYCRSANRIAMLGGAKDVGFRIALSVDAVRHLIQGQDADVVTNTGWHGWPTDAPPPAIAPFDAAQAKQHQEEWAAYLKLPVEYTNSIGMKFVLIPPGEFMMGSTAAEVEAALKDINPKLTDWQDQVRSEYPQHKVILTQANYLGVNEVTQADYEKVPGTNPSHFKAMGPGKDAVVGMDTTEHPVETVSWNDAAEFCSKLSHKEELKPFYFREGETITLLDGTGYRLPMNYSAICRPKCTYGPGTPPHDDAMHPPSDETLCLRGFQS